MYHLSSFQNDNNRANFAWGNTDRKKRKESYRRPVNWSRLIKDGKNVLSSVNRTSEEARGWVNSLHRLKKYATLKDVDKLKQAKALKELAEMGKK